MRQLVAALAVLLASASACKKPPPPAERVEVSPAQKARIDELVNAAKTGARAQDEARRALAARQPPAFVPVAALGPCAVSAKTLVPEDPESSDTNNGKRALIAKRSTRVILMTDVWTNGAPQTKADGPASRSIESVADEERKGIERNSWYSAEGIDSAIARLEAALKKAEDGYDVTFLVSRLVKPVATGNDKFESGLIAGTVYLWSRAQRAIVCAAEVESFNSDRVKIYGHDDKTWLDQNLIEAAVLDALPRLVRVGPGPASRR